MTGYGKAVAKDDSHELTVELKSVNNRYLDVSTKMPRTFVAYDNVIRELLGKKINRGHVDVFINCSSTSSSGKKVVVDLALAQNYVDCAESISKRFGVKNDFSVNSLMKTPDVITVEEDEQDDSAILALLKEALNDAADKLNEMRFAEGARLEKEICSHVNEIEKMVAEIKLLAPSVVADYRVKIQNRVTDFLQGVQVDEARLLNEVAFFSDKCNIDEEIARLTAHIAHLRDIIHEENAGRKLDFLVQEFNREANTICSKSNSTQLTNVALAVKNEIEKVREQVQNIE